jgi:hypothetical protein
VLSIGTPFRALIRDKVVAYDGAKMIFRSMMLNKGETVECGISSAALDELAGGRGKAPAVRKELHFASTLRHRTIASNISIATRWSGVPLSAFREAYSTLI